jgi:hypothetical protein
MVIGRESTYVTQLKHMKEQAGPEWVALARRLVKQSEFGTWHCPKVVIEAATR